MSKPPEKSTGTEKSPSDAPDADTTQGVANRVTLPAIPLRDIVVFPGMILPLFVGREKSITSVESAVKTGEPLFLATQKSSSIDDPKQSDIFRTGCVGKILQFLKLPDGTVKILVEGVQRGKASRLKMDPHYTAEVRLLQDKRSNATDTHALSRALIHQFDDYVKISKRIPPEVISKLEEIEAPSILSDVIAAHLPLNLSQKQEVLATTDVLERLIQLYQFILAELDIIDTEQRVRSHVKRQMEKSQREYYLNEQIKALQKELGDSEGGVSEFDALENKIKETKLTKEAKEKAQQELKKLRMMSPMAAEATVIRNYLDWLLTIPWSQRSKLKHNLTKAETILNGDHYGLEKVKERILEYLAVQERVGKVPGQILCFVGPPGVGKTSLGRSIAEATGRTFHRIALGGVRDESEIRGHRRTYIGSQPGKIIQAMRKVGVSNPLILLDEVDKLGSDWRGDPSSALLEVLDPEQNKAFGDHYLEVNYDLSDVMFLTTANTTNMPQPLLDRMEIIRLSGYTEDEKLEIAKGHLLPKQLANHGLSPKELSLDDQCILAIIQTYTQEAGVRNLERELAKICRKAVKKLVDEAAASKISGDDGMTSESKGVNKGTKKKAASKRIRVTLDTLKNYLGVPRYRHQIAEHEDALGVATGLAWTQFGGEILSIEAVLIPGKGNVKATGKLGDVMQESVQAANSFVRAHHRQLGVDADMFKNFDIHVHVPEGATPKDGPSAGVAICTALVSLLTNNPVRKDVAMTGEITLRGRVLAIGGLKEKSLAALRAGIGTILIPEENTKDIEELPPTVVENVRITPISHALEALAVALSKPLQPLPEPTTAHGYPSEAGSSPTVGSPSDITDSNLHDATRTQPFAHKSHPTTQDPTHHH